MNFLFVGDPHVEAKDIPDAKRLEGMIFSLVQEHQPDCLVLAGDLYHTHGVIDARVQEFWFNFFELVTKLIKVIVIKGNHDGPLEDGSTACALLAHSNQVLTVISEPLLLEKQFLFTPYTKSQERFVAWCTANAEATVVFCHQTFVGSKYESGIYADDGFDPALVPQRQIYSGHIHTAQRFGKVWYPGSPRWKTMHDANLDKGLYLLEFEPDGKLSCSVNFSTHPTCSKIWSLEDTPDSPAIVPAAMTSLDVLHVTSRGPSSWVRDRKTAFPPGTRWKPVITDRRVVQVKESVGVSTAFKDWVEAFQAKGGTPKERLLRMAAERLVWQ